MINHYQFKNLKGQINKIYLKLIITQILILLIKLKLFHKIKINKYLV